MKVLKDICYGNSSEFQKLDLYLPDDYLNKKLPLIFFIHGGGFSGGDKTQGTINNLAQANNQNFVIASVNYRLSGEAPFPAGINDCQQAVEFLLSKAKEYHLDYKIAFMGASSGANYALMLALNKSLTKKFKKVCVVALYPVLDLLSLINLTKKLDDDNENKTYLIQNTQTYFNKNLSEIGDDEFKKASPFHHLSTNLPSTLIQHGTADDIVPFVQSKLFFEKALKMGVDIRLDLIDGAGHSDRAFKSPQNISKIFTFIRSKLK